MLTKKELEHLATLARIDLKAGEEVKLEKDLGNILDYFKELESVDTSSVAPMTGGTDLKNVFREDTAGTSDDTGKGKEAFPDANGGYLRVPPVF